MPRYFPIFEPSGVSRFLTSRFMNVAAHSRIKSTSFWRSLLCGTRDDQGTNVFTTVQPTC
eukprot:8216952-Prorocentrum_lima.AAC.1